MIDNLSQQARLLIACALSFLVIALWQMFYVEPIVEAQKAQQQIQKLSLENLSTTAEHNEKMQVKFVERNEAIALESDKVMIENEYVKGSINLKGARIDDLILSKYKKTIDENSDNIELLSPASSRESYFIEFGWLNVNDEAVDLPSKKTLWTASGKALSQGQNVILTWKNSQNIEFTIELSLDDKYMFDIKQTVKNKSNVDVMLSSYALISKMLKDFDKATVVHEGGIGVFNEKLKELTYSDMNDGDEIKISEQPNWIGFLTSIG